MSGRAMVMPEIAQVRPPDGTRMLPAGQPPVGSVGAGIQPVLGWTRAIMKNSQSPPLVEGAIQTRATRPPGIGIETTGRAVMRTGCGPSPSHPLTDALSAIAGSDTA